MLTKHRDPLQHMLQSTFQDVTPVRLRLFLICNCLAVLFFCVFSVLTIQQHKDAAQIIGQSSAPSVIAAHNIMSGLLQMDMDLANELLYPPDSREAKKMAGKFEEARVYVAKELVAAARNITFATEQAPIERLQISLGEYEMLAAHARDVHKTGSKDEAVSAYRAALETLQTKLLPSAEELSKANSDILEAKYVDEKANSAIETSGGVVVTGFVLIALLLMTQIYLRQRFRRWFNIPLILATACTYAWVSFLFNTLTHSAEHLRVAKEDAYDSIVSLLSIRAASYDADASQSRWLLDSANAKKHEKEFDQEIKSIASFSGNHCLATTLETVRKQLARNERVSVSGFSGRLAEECNNIRFPGEGQAVLDMMQALSEYCLKDQSMRNLSRTASPDEAMRAALGYEPEACKFSFSRFDDALNRALQINELQFEKSIETASGELKGLGPISQLVALVIAICIYLGLRPRLAEYM